MPQRPDPPPHLAPPAAAREAAAGAGTGFGLRLHAFVAMPFGIKPGPDGRPIDFDRVYAELLAPALEAAGLQALRADQELRAGDIRADMFQELLVADLVLVDLTLDNPNVWYELGVRHALRARGVVLVQGPRPTQPFDIYSDRKLRYSMQSGAPDPASLEREREALATMLRETVAASPRRRVSPVYALLPHLREPQWRDLLLGDDNEFGAAYREWRTRLDVARARGLAGDVLVLAEETPTRALRVEGRLEAGNALIKLGQHALALESFDAALAIEPEHFDLHRRRALCLAQMGRREEARALAQRLTEQQPGNAEAWGLAGRLAKDRWVSLWRRGDAGDRWRRAAALESEALLEAIQTYHRGFLADPASYYAGINALLLDRLREHLRIEGPAGAMEHVPGGVRWACEAELNRLPRSYWARVTLAELALLTGTASQAQAAYRRAAAAADGDAFALRSSLRTLSLLRDLGCASAAVAAAERVLEAELARLAGGEDAARKAGPARVLLFSGHRTDGPDREQPRFPADKREAAAAAIAKVLDELRAGPGDLALTQGAAGGDLLFAHACLERGVAVRLHLPMAELQFIETSILPSDEGVLWRQAFEHVKSRLAAPLREMPTEIGPTPRGASVFERCNRWLLATALSHGPDKLAFICLWDGRGGDGPGGTQHMMQEAKRRTGRVYWIDARTL